MLKTSFLLALLFAFNLNPVQSQGVRDSVLVAIDYEQPQQDLFYLSFELGRPLDPEKPTVFAIADGQQFWARPGRAARFQEEVFGNDFNVVVVFSRAMNETVNSFLRNDSGVIDWVTAYRIFNSDQWLGDIESVRKKISPDKKIHLYGRSGGGLLLLQYLEKYNQHVDKAFCQTAPVPKLERQLGYRHDRFWQELIAYDPSLTEKLMYAIQNQHFDKNDIILTLQRQNFFVHSDEINEHRAMLIQVVFEKDKAAFDSLKNHYQVTAVKKMMPTGPGISSAVRQYEFFMLQDFAGSLNADTAALRPNMEAIKFYAEPLLAQHRQGRIPRPQSDFSVFHSMKTQVLLFAGRWDHTVDYRGQYYLSGLIPNNRLFLANDNHVFSSIYDTDNYRKIVRHALLYDSQGTEMKKLWDATKNLRWNEWKGR